MGFISQETLVVASAPASFAFTSQVAADDTVVIGDITYTFKAAPSAAYEVDIGTDLDGSIQNLVAAINADNSGETGGGGAGEAYGSGTVRHPSVTAAADLVNDEMDLTARMGGTWANDIYLAATSPGANDIAAEDVFLGGVAGATKGSGDLYQALVDIEADGLTNSGLVSELRQNILGL